MCESFGGCAPRRNFPKIRFKFFKLVRTLMDYGTEAQTTSQFRVSGINLQDLRDFCRFCGKEIFNVNSSKCP